MELKFNVANDNGNSEQAILVNGDLYRQPNTYALPEKTSFEDNSEPELLVANLLNELAVDIQSDSITFGGLFFIGRKAIKSKYTAHTMSVDSEKKYESDLPIINTLGNLAGIAVQNAFKAKNELPKEIKLSVDMSTALPVNQWTRETSRKFATRFMNGLHTVIVYVGHKKIRVSIEFDFVKVIPEGTPVLFTLIEDQSGNYRSDDMFDEFNKEYDKKVDGEYFQDKRIKHIDIGDGTTDTPLTIGYDYDRDFVSGIPTGIGHSINKAIELFSSQVADMNISRQQFIDYVKDKEHKFHADAVRLIKQSMRSEVKAVYDHIVDEIKRASFEVDVVCVYGGGSILMREILYPLLKKYCDRDEVQAEILWIPEQYATLMNVEGLNIFLNTVLPQLKEKELAAK
ncbi:ParM/StbA family protein [Sutcliffiella cohnii]|uniref:ParM/StbA family protein n=1 Tax=Sutcliffiella cohnii TaxID=33932 RepID=UPI00082AA13B|nr:ParM/StbA family protein [Sutcliffiella cohnii]